MPTASRRPKRVAAISRLAHQHAGTWLERRSTWSPSSLTADTGENALQPRPLLGRKTGRAGRYAVHDHHGWLKEQTGVHEFKATVSVRQRQDLVSPCARARPAAEKLNAARRKRRRCAWKKIEAHLPFSIIDAEAVAPPARPVAAASGLFSLMIFDTCVGSASNAPPSPVPADTPFVAGGGLRGSCCRPPGDAISETSKCVSCSFLISRPHHEHFRPWCRNAWVPIFRHGEQRFSPRRPRCANQFSAAVRRRLYRPSSVPAPAQVLVRAGCESSSLLSCAASRLKQPTAVDGRIFAHRCRRIWRSPVSLKSPTAT